LRFSCVKITKQKELTQGCNYDVVGALSASGQYRYPMYKDKRHASDSVAKVRPRGSKGSRTGVI